MRCSVGMLWLEWGKVQGGYRTSICGQKSAYYNRIFRVWSMAWSQ